MADSLYIILYVRQWSGINHSTNNVLNSSNSRLVRPIAFLRLLFVTWIILSQKPPHQGAFSTMNFHVIWLLAKNRLTSPARAILTTSLLEDLKVLALSEITVAGSPLLLVNRRNANKKLSTSRPLVNSRCTPLTDAQVNKQT